MFVSLALDWNQYFTILIIQSLCCHACSVRRRTRHRDLAHSFQIIQTTRSRSSTDRLHPRLGNSLPGTQTASLLVCVDRSRSTRPGQTCCPNCRWLPDLKHCVPFFSTCCTSTCCVLLCKTSLAVGIALLCSRVLGSLSWLFLLHWFSGSFPGCFFLHGHLARVSTNLQFPPLSESKRCPRSLQTALLWTSHK